MNFISRKELNDNYDFIFIGSGFGALFYLAGMLPHIGEDQSVLIIERGDYLSHQEQIERRRNGAVSVSETIDVPRGHKRWNFTIGLGGGTNCWWAQAPRMLPADFEIRSRYGVGRDWAVTYPEIEAFYCQAEDIMQIAGQSTHNLFPRSRPYPLPAHIPSTPDSVMLRHDPDFHIMMPTGRASVATRQRPRCCSTARCNLCPIDAKFTALNGMAALLSDHRVAVLRHTEVKALETEGGQIAAATIETDGSYQNIGATFFVLGANAIFNPVILTRSGIDHPLLGRGINEQVGCELEVFLDGMNNFDGSTATTGLNYQLYDGAHRKDAGAALIFFENRWKNTGLRVEAGRWRQTLPLIINVEDLPSDQNYVHTPKEWNKKPTVYHREHSVYAEKGLQRALARLPDILRHLPVEDIYYRERRLTESHIQGTTPMSNSPQDGIVDKSLIHHQYRNLAVVGTSVFPSCPPANPSLTAAALSLFAANKTFG